MFDAKHKISMLVFGILFSISMLNTAHAEYPFFCQAKPRNGFYVLLNRARTSSEKFHVQFYKYDSTKDMFSIEPDLKCDSLEKLSKSESLMANCHVILGPDASEDLSVILNDQTGKLYVDYVPKGPTGVGKMLRLDCQSGTR